MFPVRAMIEDDVACMQAKRTGRMPPELQDTNGAAAQSTVRTYLSLQ